VSPVKSPFLSRHFTEIKAIWLAFDSLNYFTTLKNLFKLNKVRGLYFTFYAINLLNFFGKGEWWIKKIKKPIIYIFYWFRRTMSFAYVPMRDQNLVVRDRNYRLIGFVFFIMFWKKFKIKSQVANENWFVFFNLEENRLKVKFKFDCNLIKKENKKKESLDFGSRFIMKIFLWFWIMWMFLFFFN